MARRRKRGKAVIVNSSFEIVDHGIGFMMDRRYVAINPAVAAVRAPLVMGFWIIVALTIVVVVWGMLAPIESAAVAGGTVVLLSSKKTVQHLEGGIIREILVKEGDTVKAGQPLIRLNDTASASSRDALEGQLYDVRATEARLVALRNKQNVITFDSELLVRSKTNEQLAKAIATQMQLFEAGQGAQKAKLTALNQRIAQSTAEIEGLKAQMGGAAGQLGLLNEEIGTVQTLLDKGYATKTRLYELQRNHSEVQGARGQYEAQIGKAQQVIAETQAEITNQEKEFETKNAQDLRDVQAQKAELENKLRAAKDVAARTLITAPTEGIVTGLKYHTVGGVVAPGAPIMDIVPQDDPLIIEAHIKPTDIGVVRAGLSARVIFTAYKMRSTPKVPGIVTQVSADAFTDDHGAHPTSYYTIRVQVDKQFMKTMAKPIELTPGMPAEVFIRTGSRSFLSYLFKPITDSMHSAFREE